MLSLSLPRPFRLLRDRITFSTLTKIYFLFSFVHFVVQVSIQIRAFTINHKAEDSLVEIVGPTLSEVRDPSPWLQGSILRMCYWVPSNLNTDVDSCPIVWQARDGTDQSPLRMGSGAAGDADYGSSPSTSPVAAASSSASPVAQSATSTRATTSLLVVPTGDVPSTTVETITVTATPTRSPAGPVNPVSTTPPLLAVGVDEDEDNDTDDNTAPRTPTRPGATRPAIDDDDDNDEDDDDVDVNPVSTRRTRELFKRQSLPDDWSTTITANVTVDGVRLSSTCLWTLQYPLSTLRNTKREDIVFIAFHFWVLGMSIVALLNESIPHVLASLVTHAMATAWAAFQISHTAAFRADFVRVIASGACQGVPLLPNYWKDRSGAEISSLALNAFALIISGFLTWKMIKLFGWQTFKRVGASRDINRIYKLVLTLSITIQLSLFFMIVTVSLWVDQLFNKVIGDLGSLLKMHKAFSFITLVLLIPWLMTGWFAVRRELRLPMFVFLALSVLYLGGWGLMFFSTTFRWTFLTWRFFSVMASASVALTFASAFLGVICLYNFGRGLARYLNAHRVIPEDDPPSYADRDTKYADEEKVAFPSATAHPIPTFFSPYGSVFDYNNNSGPKSAMESPFLTPPPPAALPLHGSGAVNGADVGNMDGAGVGGFPTRSNSFGSTKSSKSSSSSTIWSAGSWGGRDKDKEKQQQHSRSGSQNSSSTQGKQRWIIE